MKTQVVIFLYLLATVYASFEKRIIGGYNAVHGAFPNIVRVYGLRHTSDAVNYLFCGGVIYNVKWIVVTSDCAFGIGNILPIEYVRVIAGQWNHTAIEETIQRRAVALARRYIIYDKSQFGRSINLGLLKLNQALILGQFVSAFPFSADTTYPSGHAIIVGWGATTLAESMWQKTANVIQVLEVDVMPNNTCKEAIILAHSKGHFYFHTYFNEFNFCSGSFTQNVKGASYGDAGTAVMQKDAQGRYNVIGINSIGVPTIDLSVHTHVAPFNQWIESEIAAFPDP